MIKITDTSYMLGLPSLKKFDCPNCNTEITFRVGQQALCYKCGRSLVDVTGLLKRLTTRILYYNNHLIS